MAGFTHRFDDGPAWDGVPLEFRERREGHPDELAMAVVTDEQCALCATNVEAFVEGGVAVSVYQIHLASGKTLRVCDDHWLRAALPATFEDIEIHSGVHTLYVREKVTA